MLRASLAVLIGSTLLPAVAAAAPAAGTPPRGKPACGVHILPLVEGNSWTYVPVPPAIPADKDVERISPREPKQIVITVKSIAPKGGDTVVSLEEKVSTEIADPKHPDKKILSDAIVSSTITCNAHKFEVSPDSFFFAVEPGGYIGFNLDKIDRSKDTSFKFSNGGIGDADWREDIVAHYTPVPSGDVKVARTGGKLELERKFTPAQPENVTTKTGVYKAELLVLDTTGRVTFDTPLDLAAGDPTLEAPPPPPPPPPVPAGSGSGSAAPPPTPPKPRYDPKAAHELPAGWRNKIWFADNVGIVQSLNAYHHEYQLSDMTLK
ncbi:MAG TPA: hypothetical protein VGM88_34345 [Kofleriaceae bacterium]|jgi:hypothetical protein